MIVQPAEIIAAFIVNATLGIRANGTPTDWQVFKDWSPDEPDQVIVLYNDSPENQGKTMRDGITLLKPRVTIRTRSIEPDLGWQKLSEILTALSLVGKTPGDRVQLACQTDSGTGTVNILLKNVSILEGARTWVAQEETNRRVSRTSTVQITVSEV